MCMPPYDLIHWGFGQELPPDTWGATWMRINMSLCVTGFSYVKRGVTGTVLSTRESHVVVFSDNTDIVVDGTPDAPH